MRNFLIFIFLTFINFSFSQVSVGYNNNYGTRSNVNLNIGLNSTTPVLNGINNSSLKRGPVFFFTGLALIGAGLVTQPDMYTTPSGFQVKKPFFEQGLKSYLLIGGSVLTTVGAVFIIKDGNPKEKNKNNGEDTEN
jgi:hypothetical protein